MLNRLIKIDKNKLTEIYGEDLVEFYKELKGKGKSFLTPSDINLRLDRKMDNGKGVFCCSSEIGKVFKKNTFAGGRKSSTDKIQMDREILLGVGYQILSEAYEKHSKNFGIEGSDNSKGINQNSSSSISSVTMDSQSLQSAIYFPIKDNDGSIALLTKDIKQDNDIIALDWKNTILSKYGLQKLNIFSKEGVDPKGDYDKQLQHSSPKALEQYAFIRVLDFSSRVNDRQPSNYFCSVDQEFNAIGFKVFDNEDTGASYYYFGFQDLMGEWEFREKLKKDELLPLLIDKKYLAKLLNEINLKEVAGETGDFLNYKFGDDNTQCDLIGDLSDRFNRVAEVLGK